MRLIVLTIKTDNKDFNRDSLFPSLENKDYKLLTDIIKDEPLTLANFPYQEYIQKTNLNDPDVIANDHLFILENSNNVFQANSIMVKALTDELYPKIWLNDLNRINQIIKWVEQLNFEERSISESISIYWYTNIAHNLSNIVKASPNAKYQFKYRYLKQRCVQNDYLVDTGNSNYEKIVLYIIDQKWSHLFNRFWNSTSYQYKIIITLTILPFTILIIFGIKYLSLLVRKPKNNKS